MDLDIVYHINDARQFWAELEEIVQLSPSSTLSQLDASLRNFITFCATYHEQYLQTPVQLEHACSLLLDSELFHFHSERLSALVIADALRTTDPHAQLILHSVLLLHGRHHPSFFRSPKKWAELIPLLMDHVLLDCEWYAAPRSGTAAAVPVPVEARLRTLAVRTLYEVCRVHKFDMHALRVFTDAFIDGLFDLVEATRDMTDETLNYAIIKLIVALNEQFMVSALQHKDKDDAPPSADNRVIQVLIRRLGSSKTFGENLIFMLNRADHSAEDRVTQLLILKILYLLFTTPGTQEYFYTNDLRVLVDVFIRELGDLDEDCESLRHTYLRVLHPLLTHTQLRTAPYKRAQTKRTLESLVAHAAIRDVSPTTRRLVERCLAADWARPPADPSPRTDHPAPAPRTDHPAPASRPAETSRSQFLPAHPHPHPLRDLKFSKSVDALPDPSKSKPKTKTKQHPPALPTDGVRRGSAVSLASLASAAHTETRTRVQTHHMHHAHARAPTQDTLREAHSDPSSPVVDSPPSPTPPPAPAPAAPSPPKHRPAPAPPPKKRRPPAVPSRASKAAVVLGAGGGGGGGGGVGGVGGGAGRTPIAASKRAVV